MKIDIWDIDGTLTYVYGDMEFVMDEGTYAIDDDGTAYITWKHWDGSKKLCFHSFKTENAYINVDCNNIFHVSCTIWKYSDNIDDPKIGPCIMIKAFCFGSVVSGDHLDGVLVLPVTFHSQMLAILIQIIRITCNDKTLMC